MSVDFIDIILFVLFFQILSLAPFLILQKSRNHANIFLALFLVAKALCISNFISFRMQDTFIRIFPHLFYIGSSFTILWGPLLYFYIKALMNPGFSLQKRDFLHFTPFALHFTYLFFHFHVHSFSEKQALISAGGVLSPGFDLAYNVIVNVIILAYTVASFYLLYRYRREIKQSYSSIAEIKLSWMYFVLSGFAIKWLFDVWYLYTGYVQGAWATLPLILSRVALFLFINIMIYKGLRQPVIFSGFMENEKSKKLSLSQELTAQYMTRLQVYMDKEKPYLDPEVTLVDLAKKVGIPPRSLSEVINNAMGQNFYDFINAYRIRESQRLLLDQAMRSATVLEILYRVGYNSKSSFNNAFKKYAGMTPSQFKASQTT